MALNLESAVERHADEGGRTPKVGALRRRMEQLSSAFLSVLFMA